VRESGQVAEDRFPQVFASISFFVNSGIRFVEETCKMRTFGRMWERIGRERYGVTDERALRFRYGVQVNSLGLTEAQPENNVQRIVLEMLGVTLSRDARARSIQLPAWNEALGLPRPWDQQWALRMQQVLAYESDLLEYPDLFEGSKVVEGRTAELVDSASAELDDVLALGGAFEAIDELKGRLVRSNAERMRRIEDGELTVVGVNRFTETAPSPLTASADSGGHILKVDPALEAQTIAELAAWRSERDNDAVKRSLDQLRQAAESDENIMAATIDLAHAGGTTGEWAGTLREVFGEYRAPTGVAAATGAGGGSAGLRGIADRVRELPGGPPRLLVAKPGLDGHSNGAEQIAVAARDAGMEVIYQGIRLTPEQIAAVAVEEDVDVIGLSILSGSHLELVPAVVRLVREGGVDAPVVVGGIVPEEDRQPLLDAGVAAVYTPKDFELVRIMSEIVDLAVAHRDAVTQPPR
jgi:(2R)-ethylmalonyl-CoA mutase